LDENKLIIYADGTRPPTPKNQRDLEPATCLRAPNPGCGWFSNFGRENAGHRLAAVFAVNCKIYAIQGEDHGGTIEFCHAHEAGIRQVHLAILI
jgi:hypothetical protein